MSNMLPGPNMFRALLNEAIKTNTARIVHGVLFDKTNLLLTNLRTQRLHHVVSHVESRVMSETLAQLWVWWVGASFAMVP